MLKAASLRALKARIEGLEVSCQSRSPEVQNCNCRELTFYHTPDELQLILQGEADVPCPTHGLRDLGQLRQPCWPYWQILVEDLHYCGCPPHCERDFAYGKRADPPTKEEKDADSEAHFQWALKRDFNEDRREEYELISKYYAKVGRSVPPWMAMVCAKICRS